MLKINPNKLIPTSKDEMATKIVGTLVAIKINLTTLNKNTKATKKQNKKQIEEKKKEDQTSDKLEKETKKESLKPRFKIPTIKLPSMPRLGIFDFIKNFVTMMIFGFLLAKFFKHLPKLVDLAKILIPIAGWIEKTLGNLFEATISFIDFSYDKFDGLRNATKSIIGEDYQKTYDAFTSALDKYLNIILIGGLLIASSGALGGGGGRKGGGGKPTGGKPPTGGTARPVNPKKSPNKVTTSTERPTPKPGRGPKITGTLTDDAVAATGKRVAGKGVSIMSKGLFVIGPLIDFGIRTLVFKEPADKAAVGAISTGIGQAIGSSLGGVLGGIVGSVIPVAGTLLAGGAGAVIGGLIGGFIGDWIGSSLYELIKNGQKKTPRVQGRAKGGQITRNGKKVGGAIKRTVKKAKKSPKKVPPKKLTPGKDVGGKKEITKLFPSPDDPKKRNPLKTLEFAATRFNKDPLFGPLKGAAVTEAMGQRVDKSVYKTIANNFGTLIQNMMEGYISANYSSFNSNVMAMAEGGIVPPRTGGLTETSFGEKFGELMAKSFESMMNNSVNDIFQNIMKQYKLEDFGGSEIIPSDGGPLPIDGSISSIDIKGFSKEDVDALGRMVAAESAGETPLGKAGVLAVILNRYRLIKSGKISPSGFNVVNKPKDQITIRDIIFAGGKGPGNQFSPYRDGNFDRTSSTSGAAALAAAINAGGNDPEKFKQNLIKNAKLSEQDADYVVRSVSFSNPASRDSRPFNTKEVRVGNHVFQQSPNVKLSGDIGALTASVSTNGLTEAVIMKGGARPSKNISSEQGMRGEREHKGVDVAGGPWKVNAPLTVIQPGRVIYTGWQNPNDRRAGWGQFVIIKHNNGLYTLYAHLNKINVAVGQSIKVGEDGSGTVIGLLGNTGRSTGPHLHFEIARNYSPVILSGHLNARSQIDSYVTIGGKVVKKEEKNKLNSTVNNLNLKPEKFSPNSIVSSFANKESFRKHKHEGEDLRADQGTPISFARGGEIINVSITNSTSSKANGGYGSFIDVKLSDGKIIRVAHLSKVPNWVKLGEKFKANEVIAYSGGAVGTPGAGRSGGPHIHYEQHTEKMGIEETLKNKVDPSKGGAFDLIQKGGTERKSNPPKISAIPTQTNIPQQIAKWDTASMQVQETIIAKQVVEKRISVPTPTPLAKPLFPGESPRVNNDKQREILAVG
jgi:murein DD-endopeptidase MepM/ murein hydrolase activator NlpD